MTRFIRKKKIIVPSSKISVLAERFGCKRVAVYNALAYRSDSDMSERIRMVAMSDFGGRNVLVPMYK